jgi:hypothetical protein
LKEEIKKIRKAVKRERERERGILIVKQSTVRTKREEGQEWRKK